MKNPALLHIQPSPLAVTMPTTDAQTAMTDFDTRSYRKALSQFPTGVTIMTALLSDGRPVGMTVNSFASVSLSPPVILWSIARSTPSYAVFANAKSFVVNFLAEDQKHLSNKFSRPSEDKFADVAWTPGLNGVPVLAGCVAHIECTLRERHAVGDHDILLGNVARFAWDDKPPLAFALSDYKRLAEVLG